jgi:hypothetical protein
MRFPGFNPPGRIADFSRTNAAGVSAHLPEYRHVFVNSINIPLNMFNRTDGKAGALVNRTKLTVIPGAVPGYPYQQAGSLTGRSDGALFQPVIGFVCLVLPAHGIHAAIFDLRFWILDWLSVISKQ